MRLVYAGLAVGDLDRLRRFIATHDPAAARRTVDRLIARVERLAAFPAMGREVDLGSAMFPVRQLAFDAYVVRYMVTADAVIVLRIRHHREDEGSAS